MNFNSIDCVRNLHLGVGVRTTLLGAWWASDDLTESPVVLGTLASAALWLLASDLLLLDLWSLTTNLTGACEGTVNLTLQGGRRH